ncbi:MAG: urea ABC transporter permease subunit UrtB [Pseudomonadota bacterium]
MRGLRWRDVAVLLLIFGSLALSTKPLSAQAPGPVQSILQEHRDVVAKSSRRTVGPVIEALTASGLDRAPAVLEAWRQRRLYQRTSDGLFFIGEKRGGATRLIDPDTGADVGEATRETADQLRPNGGVRGVIGSALVQFQLNAPDPETRRRALQAIERDPEKEHLEALGASIKLEPDPLLRARKERLRRLIAIRFAPDEEERVAAIESFRGDIGVDVRAALNPLVNTRLEAVAGDAPPETRNVARILSPGGAELSREAAYDVLVEARLAPPRVDREAIRAALIANIADGAVAGVPVASLDTDAARLDAYAVLASTGAAPAAATEAEIAAALGAHTFFLSYAERLKTVTDAAEATLDSINLKLGAAQGVDLLLDGLSLASIYFLAAIGLAITFGVMGVINMAHGEFIMMGAYTGYVVQLFVPDYTLSLIIALPLAFAVTFAAGVALERTVIRWLYQRPLETLLATFGVSIALQQLAKNIFGTQARPLTAPDWLDGALVINDVISISYIRIAIFVLALLFLALFLLIMNKTRLGLEVRAVTQNPRMAASMGINPDRINMLTFGFGSGIAGVAGVAIGLFAQVTSELGQQYIVQSFMTVVVGGVGNIWGALAGATMIGGLQKAIEWLNPSNTLAAQTYMILFVILFIQFRPRGMIALKGRAAEA